ncbi:hypothetical protein [Bdellovibrio reynosensis]|uniref:Uncharacterized protein n=1 Tax=Bdellovibrio reynosensis TaxID=2835041 RepID=A0ABY4C8Z4_9BACT|nr:hypothetical protein [Bdellovibrio reynosensis]UOF01249.1 hypothetical protein MNR06_16260 [Bdellovibrio reynosensis]
MIKNENAIRYCSLGKKIVITAFFTLNVSIMIVDGLPDKSLLGSRFLKSVAQYQAWSMLYQPWAMFAPNPMNTTAFVEAQVEFTDGTFDTWQIPRPQNAKGWQRLVADRYRILGQETLLPNTNELVWFDFSKFVTNQVQLKEKEGKNRTVKNLSFHRKFSRVIPPPQGPLIPHGQLSTSFESEPVFAYQPNLETQRYEANNSN